MCGCEDGRFCVASDGYKVPCKEIFGKNSIAPVRYDV